MMPFQAMRLRAAPPPPVGGYRFWRINIQSTRSGDSWFAMINEIEMRAAIGGPDLCNGGSASASSFDTGTYTPSNAFDNDPATDWLTLGGVPGPAWIQYEFPSGVDVAEVSMRAGGTSGRAARMPMSFSLLRSTDGSSWETRLTQAGIPAWSASQTRAFVV